MSTLAGAPTQNGAQTTRVDPRIGAAKPQIYRSIRDAKDWKNPYLVIRTEGVEIITERGREVIPVSNLERRLSELPIAAWPYGTVVAVQEVGIRRSDRSDERPISDNRNAVFAILKSLEITVEHWPA